MVLRQLILNSVTLHLYKQSVLGSFCEVRTVKKSWKSYVYELVTPCVSD